ncbi:hypothetical protein ACFQRD_02800 [Brachybacterium sp. GCM10030268]|uniref:hypothetical protein n=1 Tax=Brachybacterium sp. GCM10030268 TaxID=3273382 RepID=UPI003618E0FE
MRGANLRGTVARRANLRGTEHRRPDSRGILERDSLDRAHGRDAIGTARHV